jgi:putative cell wall-binding protein
MRIFITFLLVLVVALSGIVIEPRRADAAEAPIKVGVVYSLITYNATYPGLILGGANYTSRCNDVLSIVSAEFPGAAMIGDSVLADLTQLRQYDVIVAPRLLALTSVQRNNIRAYVAEGGGLVGSFGVSRWDYTAGRSPYPYDSLIALWQFSDSWDMSRAWEWGELSELYQVKFANDPLTYAGYTIAGGSAGTHPILANALARPEVSTLNMTAKQPDYNELVWSMKGNDNITPLFTYANATTKDPAYPANGTAAGWAAPYYFGKVAYFGFQLHDMARSSYYADAASQATARGVLLESVRWAGTRKAYSPPVKQPTLSATAWLTKGKLYINETVANTGEAQLRGYLKVYVYNPKNQLVFSGTAKNQPVPLPASASYTLTSWQPYVGVPAAGTWRVVCTYDFYDWLKGGTVTASRTLSLSSDGSTFKSLGMGTQTYAFGNRPVIGEQIAGTDRYGTAVAISKRGWPVGASVSNAVILATAANYPDALAAAPLAGKLDAPVLLIGTKTVHPAVADELKRLYSGRTSASVYVVGGQGALPDTIISAYSAVLSSAGVTNVQVKRLPGVNRYDTARSIALEVGAPTSGTFADTAIIVSGGNYPDALAMGPLAAKMGVPILPVASSVPPEIGDALQKLGIKHSIIVGGTSVVSTTIENSLELAGYRVGGVPNGAMNVDTRLAGTSRYDTGLQALRFSVAMGAFDESYVYAATGRNWPDALALAGASGKASRPLLLLDGTDLVHSKPSAEYLISRQGSVPALGFVGGDSAVSKYVRGKVRIALGVR